MKIWLMLFNLATWLPILFMDMMNKGVRKKQEPQSEPSQSPNQTGPRSYFELKVVELVLRLTTALRLVGELMREYKSYTCANGYRLFGEKNLYCTSSQEWHAPAPICKVHGPSSCEFQNFGTHVQLWSPDKKDEESEALVTEKITQTISTAVKSQSLYAAVCEDVRKMAESLSCGMNWIETKCMMEMEKLRLEKLKFQLERGQGNQPMYAKET